MRRESKAEELWRTVKQPLGRVVGIVGTASRHWCGLASELSVGIRRLVVACRPELILSSSREAGRESLVSLMALADDNAGLTSTFQQPRRSRCPTRRPRTLRSSGPSDVRTFSLGLTVGENHCRCLISCELRGPQ